MSVRRTITALCIFIITVLLQTTSYTAPAFAVLKAPTQETSTTKAITAPTGFLINAASGDILWQKNADKKSYVASTTKMLTAILALEYCNLDETVTIGAEAVNAGKSGGINLNTRERFQLRDLLYAMMLYSANDAATAVAIHVAGTEKEFASLMNRKALQIGCTATHFTNASGLPDDLHYSTAHDLSRIAQYALQNPMFARLVAARAWKIPRSDSKQPSLIENRNRLLWDYRGANGVKTGHTKSAAYCLVSSARRENVALIAVVLGTPSYKSVFYQSSKLLDYGFDRYKNSLLIEKKKTYKVIFTKYDQRVELVAADSVSDYVRRDILIKYRFQMSQEIKLPIRKGTVLGNIDVMQNGRIIGESALIAKNDIPNPTVAQLITFYWSSVIKRIF